MSMYFCHACDRYRDADADGCTLVLDANELVCERCVSDYCAAHEERHGEDITDADELPTWDKELVENFRERDRRERWDRQVAAMGSAKQGRHES